MKKLNITDIRSSEMLTIEEKKNVMGGVHENGSTGIKCIMCTTSSGMSSCWYSSGNPYDACNSIYPEGASYSLIDCRKLDCGIIEMA